MVSLGLRARLKFTARVLTLAGAVGPLGGLSQPVDGTLAEREQQVVATIERLQLENGTKSELLIEPLTRLSLLYQEAGNPVLASAMIEEARQIVRVNYGLSSLEEAPLLRQAIRNEEELGNVELAWSLEQDLLGTLARHADDARTAPYYQEIADKRIDLLARYVDGDFPPQLVLGCYFARREPLKGAIGSGGPLTRSCLSGSRSVLVKALLAEAQGYYNDAIWALLSQGLYASDALREAEMAIVRSSYRYGDYDTGRLSLRRIVSYRAAGNDSLLTRVEALLEMADWEVLAAHSSNRYGDYEAVRVVYQDAYAQLAQQGIEQASIDALFAPSVPVVLPTFLPNPLAVGEAETSAGYVDVSFDVTARGQSENVEVVDASDNAPRTAVRDLVRTIERASFRPRVVDGELVDAAPVVMRYYLGE